MTQDTSECTFQESLLVAVPGCGSWKESLCVANSMGRFTRVYTYTYMYVSNNKATTECMKYWPQTGSYKAPNPRHNCTGVTLETKHTHMHYQEPLLTVEVWDRGLNGYPSDGHHFFEDWALDYVFLYLSTYMYRTA